MLTSPQSATVACEGKWKPLRRQLLLAVLIQLIFRTFQYFPALSFVQEAWFVVSMLTLLVVYPFIKIRQSLRFTAFEVYLLLLLGFAFVVPPLVALRTFGQPMIYGMLAQRTASLLVWPLIFYNAVKRRTIQLEDIEKALLLSAWGTYFLFTLIRCLFRPEDFGSYGFGLVMETDGGLAFRLTSYSITFAIVYYLLRGIESRNWKFYLYAAILLTPIGGRVGSTGRSLTLCLMATFIAYLYKVRPRIAFFTDLAKTLAACALLITALTLIAPSQMGQRAGKFSDAFTVVLGGGEVEDMSANTRLFETLAALPYIQEHPITGAGALSLQWQSGTTGLLGQFFHPSDIGLFGILFNYGILGIFVYGVQFIFAARAVRVLFPFPYSRFIDGCAGAALYFALFSISTGLFVFFPEITIFFTAILTGAAAIQKASVTGHPAPITITRRFEPAAALSDACEPNMRGVLP